MKHSPHHPSRPALRRRALLQVAFVAALIAAAFVAGQRSAGGAPGARPAAGGGARGAGGSVTLTELTVSDCPDVQVDMAYDIVAGMAATARRLNASWAPARRPGFVKPTNPNQALYDQMWTATGGNDSYKKSSCWGCRFVGDVVARLEFDTVLDAGTGNGGIVRAMQVRGKSAWGIELSQAVLDQDAPDLLKEGRVEQGSLTDLPYQDKQFDLVYSADVLEHILPDQVGAVVSELVRVAKRHVVLSISLKSYENEKLHSLLRPRAWWDARFEAAGARVNRALVWALQQKENRFKPEDFTRCRQEGDAADGGKFEVCVVATPWLVGRPGQELRRHRCVTRSNLELEPWIFAYRVD